MALDDHPLIRIERGRQRLSVVPTLGAAVAAWQWLRDDGEVDLWRPWDGAAPDRYTFACFPLVPWSNRISGGGFEHEGRFYPVAPNRVSEPYPIHGDGWLQAWDCAQPSADTLVMTLESRRFDGDPYAYRAEHCLTLRESGMDQSLAVTHHGEHSMPYGLGLHPYFLRGRGTRIAAPVKGVWLSGDDPLPTRHTADFPATWNLSDAPADGVPIDNAYTGWSGEACITWPARGVRLDLRLPQLCENLAVPHEGYCLVYRPPAEQPFFCFEPITHPIDAFHLPGRPGLRVLETGQSMHLDLRWRFAAFDG